MFDLVATLRSREVNFRTGRTQALAATERERRLGFDSGYVPKEAVRDWEERIKIDSQRFRETVKKQMRELWLNHK